jgi:uncharacterized lipoprotein YmbA
MKIRICLTAIALMLLAGCGSSPKTHFYTLNNIPGTASRHSLSYPVQLTAVHVPPSLDRRQMVSRTGVNQVSISETNQWSAPIDIMMRNVLAQDLVARLPKDKVILPEAPAPESSTSLVVSVSRFAADPTGTIDFSGSWSLLRNGETLRERQFEFRRGQANDPDSTAAVMSELLGELADRIAISL